MDLFDYMREDQMEKESPLASRLRPITLDDIVGQQHIIGKDKLLYRAIKADKLSSIILYGPPGTGKTTIAKVIANTTSAAFTQINATVAGKKDMEQVVHDAKERMGMYGRKTILFVDEIHRFNKGQQDYLLPFVEDGTVILIGATTENPYFEVNGALISRSIIFELKPLSKEDIKILIHRAVYDMERGMGAYNADITEEAADFLADMSGGDARLALNAIEIGVLTTEPSEDGRIHITLEVASECIQRRVMRYDKTGDNHYDTISAFIKSMRGSDPDAAVYYLARMLYAGEEPAFIARRIMICASEDVGNADPQALQVAVAAAQAVERLGMPEARITLAQAATYVACAPKSNAAICAIDEAFALVKKSQPAPIPPYLQDAHYGGAARLGHGIGYQYAHNFPNHYVRQQYLPDAHKDEVFYRPGDLGYEKTMKAYLKYIKEESEQS
jgi:putative ATPase